VGIDLLLVTVGLAVLYYYVGQGIEIDGGLSPEEERDLIFPVFAMQRLPVGCGGAILAALLAAAMSTIDSGVNSIATVITVELHQGDRRERCQRASHVGEAMVITLTAGAFITLAAFAISFLPARWGIVGAIPRTFNLVTGPLGGLFLIGIFLPSIRQRAAIAATICGLLTSVVLGYLEQIGALLRYAGLIDSPLQPVSFTWILPASFVVTLITAPLWRPLDWTSP
jgi:SSS family solute:Na+ symporter